MQSESIHDILAISIQACVNTYDGKYGAVNHDMFHISNRFTNGHVEWDMCWQGDETAVIAFKGTDGFRDWKDNLTFDLVTTPFPCLPQNAKIHHGFLEQYIKAQPIIMHFVSGYRVKQVKRILVTGHSLGGALATLCAFRIASCYPQLSIICVTFGAPRVGNRAFVRAYNKQVPETFRVVNGYDMVCNVPPVLLGYRHAVSPITIGKKPWWWVILHPLLALFGNPIDHYPEKYLDRILTMKK